MLHLYIRLIDIQPKHLPLIESDYMYMCPTCRRKRSKTLDLFFFFVRTCVPRERAYVITQTDNGNAMIIDK